MQHVGAPGWMGSCRTRTMGSGAPRCRWRYAGHAYGPMRGWTRTAAAPAGGRRQRPDGVGRHTVNGHRGRLGMTPVTAAANMPT
jgi:hypothetical protein